MAKKRVEYDAKYEDRRATLVAAKGPEAERTAVVDMCKRLKISQREFILRALKLEAIIAKTEGVI